ncbi:MAG: hypothetical protein ABI036_13155 [Fibrobacteria bacterium]
MKESGTLLLPAPVQFLILGDWILFAILSFIAFQNPTRWTSGSKWVVYSGLAIMSLWIMFFWWWTANSGSGNWRFAWSQLVPTLVKVSCQVLLLGIALIILYSLSKQLGEKTLPHLLGIEFKFPSFPNAQVILPGIVWAGSVFMAVVCAWFLFLAVQAYGLVSPLGFGAFAGLLLVSGSWWQYRCLAKELAKELADKTAYLRSVRENPSAQPDSLTMSRYRRLVEYRLGTREWNAMTFHRMADEPYGLAYRFPGYLIGVEQANRYLIDVPKGDNVTAAGKKESGIAPLLNDRRRTFVSHIFEFDDRNPGTRGGADAPSAEMVRTRKIYNIYESPDYDQAFKRGFDALDTLRGLLDAKLAVTNGEVVAGAPAPSRRKAGAYTHILVYCMGWNTDQQESMRNYNSLMGFLAEAAEKSGGGEAFRPLVIGLTWPSEWSAMKGISYVAKAGDADETGLVWGSYLLKKVLKPLKVDYALPLVVVGHSFGVRVLTRAVASNPDWVKGADGGEPYVDESDKVKEIDLFVGLQGAVSANRFVKTGPLISGWVEGSPYAKLPGMATRFILTWANGDKANPIAAYVTGAHHVGGRFGNEFCLQHKEAFWPVLFAAEKGVEGDKDWGRWPYDQPGRLFQPDSGWTDLSPEMDGKIITMDVSGIVKDQPYGKGGGAHSDIYTPEIGRFLWKSIVAFAP